MHEKIWMILLADEVYDFYTNIIESLAGFLNAWLGGPSDWFVEHPGVCMMSAHARLPITRETADQWADAMRRAITASPVEPVIAGKMAEALGAMAQGMAPNPGQAM